MKRVRPVVLAMVCLLGPSLRADVFRDGDRVCFLGDSITHTGSYHGMIYDYCLTRSRLGSTQSWRTGQGDREGSEAA